MEFIKKMPMTTSGCVFCALPSENSDQKNLILYRGKSSFMILNRYPYNSGHLMVIPFEHTSNLATLNDEALLEVHQLIVKSMGALKKAMNAQGFNVGMNLGEAGGAGIREHLHYHVVPRWNGDTNYMPVLGETKVLPESLDETFERLASALA
jgi:ATP adenylyltransferase